MSPSCCRVAEVLIHSIFNLGCICVTIVSADPILNFRASKSVDRQILCTSSETSPGGKIVKGSVGVYVCSGYQKNIHNSIPWTTGKGEDKKPSDFYYHSLDI